MLRPNAHVYVKPCAIWKSPTCTLINFLRLSNSYREVGSGYETKASIMLRFVLWWDMAATVRLALFLSFVSRALSQAPGDGDSLCVDATINGVPNPFFTNITYPANERPLMDSRDYVTLLDAPNPPWQQVDNDNNNTDELVTHVRYCRSRKCAQSIFQTPYLTAL